MGNTACSNTGTSKEFREINMLIYKVIKWISILSLIALIQACASTNEQTPEEPTVDSAIIPLEEFCQDFPEHKDCLNTPQKDEEDEMKRLR